MKCYGCSRVAFDITRKVAVEASGWRVKYKSGGKWKFMTTTYETKSDAEKAAKRHKESKVVGVKGWRIKSHTKRNPDGSWHVYPKLYDTKDAAQKRIQQMVQYKD